jgi:hypothetical protein
MNDALEGSGKEKPPRAGALASREVRVMKPILRNGLELVGHLDYRDLTVEVRGLRVAPAADAVPPSLLDRLSDDYPDSTSDRPEIPPPRSL